MAEPGRRRRDRPDASRPLLERDDLGPDDRVRIGRAVVGLLGWALIASATLGILAIWHLVRRGRVLRANQPPPKVVLHLEVASNSESETESEPEAES
jgi:hypothetical protein